MADPSDIFTMAAPTAAPAATQALGAGGNSISTQTGAFTYNYPIAVPPGRHGMQPSLALGYSSQGSTYGGLAAGWTLGIPIITQYTELGRTQTLGASPAPVQYQSSLSGGRRLIPVTEPTQTGYTAYRADDDSAFMRYQRATGTGFQWRVLDTNGHRYYFGDADHTSTCTTISDTYAPLTREVDEFGNQVDYYYESANGECRISSITWGENSVASLSTFANITFGYAASTPSCEGVPVGQQISYRTGTRIVSGANELDTITVVVNPSSPEHTTLVTLGYATESASCTANHGAYRSLTSIQESAWGTDAPRVDLPAVKFTYNGTPQYPLQQSANLPWAGNEPLPHVYSLAWGYRFSSSTRQQWPTIEAMMLDVDGDGLPDRVRSAPLLDSQGNTLACAMGWKRNLGAGHSFGPEQIVKLPTLKWADPAHGYTGGAYANADTNPVDLGNLYELCSLNYQLTGYRNSYGQNNVCEGDPTFTSPNICSGSPGQCPNNESCSSTPSGPGPATTYLSYRWIDIDGDGRVDLVVSPKGSSAEYDLLIGSGAGGTSPIGPIVEPTLLGNFSSSAMSCPAYEYAPRAADLIHEYSVCKKMFPWFIYRNHGNGVFGVGGSATVAPQPDSIKFQPMPLEGETADASPLSTQGASTTGLLDLDGDGRLDGISAEWTPTGHQWALYRGDGTGQLTANSSTDPGAYLWGAENLTGSSLDQISAQGSAVVHDASGNTVLDQNGNPVISPVQTQGVLDLNGDGLPEHWIAAQSHDLSSDSGTAEINDGSQFRLGGNGVGELSLNRRPGSDVMTDVYQYNGQDIEQADRYDMSRAIDLDGDGRPDALRVNLNHIASIYYNQGGQFSSTAVTAVGSTEGGGANHYMVANDLELLPSPETWEITSDLFDLDGDGMLEGILFGSGPQDPRQARITHAVNTQPPRLLATIDNQRGAVTSVTYATMEDTTTVTQDPSTNKVMPKVAWVVKSVSTTDSASTAVTNSVTSYQYVDPEYIADDVGLYGFRGFDEVHTIAPSGAVTIDRYGYDVDWRGLLDTTLVVPQEAPTEVRSIQDNTWTKHSLFSGAVGSYFATQEQHWTCKNGQNEAACRANTDTVTTTTETLTGYSGSGGPTKLYAVTGSTTTGSASTRTTTTTYVLDTVADVGSPDDVYRLRVAGTLKQVGTTTYAQTAATWDSSYRVPLTSEVWVDANNANRNITRFDYDMPTGNVLHRWKPVQNAGDQAKVTYTYDARGVYVATEVNELGQELDYSYDYSNGTRLTTMGPNVAGCAQVTPSTCGTNPPKQEHKTRLDGIGRAIERWETYSDDGSIYTLREVETNAYDDGSWVASSLPTSCTHQNGVDVNGSGATIWAMDKTAFDGLGRPIKKTVLSMGAVPADAITSYQYDNAGNLAFVVMPDPSLNTTATVLYTYYHDSLGRLTMVRRPISGNTPNGVSFAYDGLKTTTTELLGSDGGNAASKVITKDVFGRVVQEDEALTASPITYATTTYTYTPDDNVSTIVGPAPDHVTTTLVHDFAGHRTQIQRAGQTWSLTYDSNGNVVAETVPGWTTLADQPNYTNTTVYDDLDRPTSKTIGQRTLSSADQTLFADRTESYTWDYGNNRIGLLRYWRSYAPGASTPSVLMDLANNAQGQATTTNETLNLAGFSNLNRQYYRNYYITGQLRSTYYRDYVGGTNETKSVVNIDARGFPASVTLTRTGEATTTVGVQTRNVAGLVMLRHSDLGGGLSVDSNWTYDELGRVLSQKVTKSPSTATIVEQDLSYYGNDDVSLLIHTNSLGGEKFQYQYDQRHQLTSVTDTEGNFAATYAYQPSGRFASAMESSAGLPGSDVTPRNVTYGYAGTDPEQVTDLITSTGQQFAKYQYDAAGNETNRTQPGVGQWTYIYDGHDRLRRATHYSAAGSVSGIEEYWYDGNGQRIITLERNASATITDFTWFFGDTEAHYDNTGVVDHVYSHVSLGTPVARVDRSANTSTSLEYQFHGLGDSTLATVGTSGSPIALFTYAPFGELVSASDSSPNGVEDHLRRFNDKQIEPVADLANYGVRLYDKTQIGWTQADPLYRFVPDLAKASGRRANIYEFSLNNPLRYVDPDGTDIADIALCLTVGCPRKQTLSGSVKSEVVGFARANTSGLMAAVDDYALGQLGVQPHGDKGFDLLSAALNLFLVAVTGDPEDGGFRGTNRDGELGSRATRARTGTIEKAWDALPDHQDGGKACPGCKKQLLGEPGSGIPRDWEVNHSPQWAFRWFRPGTTREMVLDAYNEAVNILCPTCNRKGNGRPGGGNSGGDLWDPPPSPWTSDDTSSSPRPETPTSGAGPYWAR